MDQRIYHNLLKWLSPGIGIKRWIGLGALGVLLLVIGTAHLRAEALAFLRMLDAVIVVCGIIILILGIKGMMRSFIAAFIPASRGSELVDILYQRRQLSRGPRIIAVGGGTGLAMLLSGLKEYSSNISAIVTVADDGGSSGRLRQQFDILPPGDIRNCLVALADAPALMRDLFQFRFEKGSEFSGHSFGNLFITVMTRVTGDFEKAIKETSKVLALRGRVIPSTLQNITLGARHQDGSTTEGEDSIPRAHKQINRVYLNPPDAQAAPDALKAIAEAQVIVLGPGSLYTSIIPNLLIREVGEAIASSPAAKVYVCNAMTQPGETDGYSACDHVRALTAHSNPREIAPQVLKRYAAQNSYAVVNDRKKIEAMGYRVIEDDFTAVEEEVIRHRPDALAKIILGLIEEI
jgi:uncharacterized cofD-like protein